MTTAGPARLSALRVAAFAVLGAILLGWPMLLLDGPVLFWDSVGYLNRGADVAHAIGTLTASVIETDVGGGGGGVTGRSANRIEVIRSIPYDVFTYLAGATPLGRAGIVIAQTMIVLAVLRLLIDRELDGLPRDTALAVGVCASVTALPWFASYLMPDLLAALVILTAMVLVRGVGRIGIGWSVLLGGALFFALVAHYGNIPFAVGLVGAALALLLVQGRLTGRAVAIGVLPVALAMGANLAGGYLAFDAPSIAPRRIPLLLARSIEDGPARWHLQENCATERYAICELVPEIPDNIGTLMWGDEGLVRRATLAQMDRIRAEESLILRRAFAEYPLQQTWALARNGVEQVVSIGSDDFLAGEITTDVWGDHQAALDRAERRGLFDAAAAVNTAVVLAAIVLIAVLARRDGLRAGLREREMLAMLVLGLLFNAAIFGGLSAPVDRYQGRVVWLVPVFAAMLWLERRRRRAQA